MAYTYNSPNFDFGSPMWNDVDTSDTSAYLWDSPQPDYQPLPQPQESKPPLSQQQHQSHPQNGNPEQVPGQYSNQTQEQVSQQKNQADISGKAAAMFSMPSSASESSDHSSTSNSSTQKKRKSSRSASPPDLFGDTSFLDASAGAGGFDSDKLFDDSNSAMSAIYPGMGDGTYNGPDFGELSLDSVACGSNTMMNMANQNNAGYSNQLRPTQDQGRSYRDSRFATLYSPQNGSPQMPTIQPSQTQSGFGISSSRGNSPMLFGSHESSPRGFANTGGSPFSANNDMMGATYSNSPAPAAPSNLKHEESLDFGMETSRSQPVLPELPQSLPSQPTPASNRPQYPCKIDVAPTPEKSRVETQIPIDLRVTDLPKHITKIHLPAHTISKPKFQAKPPHQKSADTAELTAMLVCASAMRKDGLLDAAFERAARDEIFVPQEENQPAAAKVQTDDPDPNKPLNGGPVSICSGCINRERKRAARKKTKKQDEEEEWARDESRRIIVFNCPEVREWFAGGTKDTPIKESDGQCDHVFVKAPMRIACYCRHQNEKLGFQVLFTLRDSDEKILGQGISQSIMITDDHKQPGVAHGQFHPNGYPMMPMWGPGFPMGQPQASQLPFRTSFSTNDLTKLGNFYQQQRIPPGLSRQSSGFDSTMPSTASATPRNLSRPASPSNDQAPSAKKRRAGSGNSKYPAHLSMTRMDNNLGSRSMHHNQGPTSAGPMQSGFHFSQPSQHGYGRWNQSQSPNTSDPYASGPTTPLYGPTGGMTPNSAFGTNTPGDYPFYSAPTSQRNSRAASPVSSTRRPHSHRMPQRQSSGYNDPQFQNTDGQPMNPNALFAALAGLPSTVNPSDPPIIQKIVPYWGHVTGGTEITVLGSGFVPGLEVCFGDAIAPQQSIKIWSPNSLVLHAPPAEDEGQVAVVFRHQHPKFSKGDFRRMVGTPGLMPTSHVLYTYLDDDQPQMQQLEAAVHAQTLSR